MQSLENTMGTQFLSAQLSNAVSAKVNDYISSVKDVTTGKIDSSKIETKEMMTYLNLLKSIDVKGNGGKGNGGKK